MESQKIRIAKKQFRIGELAKELNLKKFVIRFWEKEFGIKSSRSKGGQRFYTEEDLKKFKLIKDLLYTQKFTIPGAKKQLAIILNKKSPSITPAQKDKEHTKVVEKTVTVEKVVEKPIKYIPKEFLDKLKLIKKQLLEFKVEMEDLFRQEIEH